MAALHQVAALVPGLLTRAVYDQCRSAQHPTSHAVVADHVSWGQVLTLAGLTERADPRSFTTAERQQRSIVALREVAACISDGPLTMALYRENRAPFTGPSPEAIAHLFGSWPAALTAAGLHDRTPIPVLHSSHDAPTGPQSPLPPPAHHPHRDRAHPDGVALEPAMIAALRDVAARTTGPLTRQLYDQHHTGTQPASRSILACCAPWAAAVRAAGLPGRVTPNALTTTERRALHTAAIRHVLGAACARLTAAGYDAHRSVSHPSSASIIREFGSWRAAVIDAGMDTLESPSTLLHATRQQQDRTFCVASIRGVAAHAGRPFTMTMYRHQRDPSLHANVHLIGQHFPTWDDALTAAGVDTTTTTVTDAQDTPPPTGTDPERSDPTLDRCRGALQRIAAAVDGSITTSLYQQHRIPGQDPSLVAIFSRFPSWPAALAAAGLGERVNTRDTARTRARAAAINALQEVAATITGPVTVPIYEQHHDPHRHPCTGSIYRYFTSWPTALKAAGLADRIAPRGRPPLAGSAVARNTRQNRAIPTT